MAAIAQSDPYSIVSRKIGYSVGLEYLVRNVGLLTSMYARDARLTSASWLDLVTSKEGFGRDSSAEEHFANFYYSIGLIRRIGREIHALNRLDCLSILKRTLDDKEEFHRALRFILCHTLVDMDADIFLNALSADFDPSATRNNIETCLQTKWDAFSGVLLGRGSREKLWDHLRIKSFQVDKPVTGRTGGRFVVRTESIDEALKRTHTSENNFDLAIPPKYFDKALTPRRGWGIDLGLCDGRGKRTDLGDALLNEYGKLGLLHGSSIVFWPYGHEMAPIKIDPSKISQNIQSPWAVLSATATAWGSAQNYQEQDDKIVDLVVNVYEKYRDGDLTKRMLRQQLPLFVLYPTYIASCVARHATHTDLPTFLDKKFREPERIFNHVAIRGTEGAIEVKR